MGAVTIAAMLGTYFIATYLSEEPQVVALIVLLTAVIIFTIGYFIINSFSYLAEANRMKSEFVSITSHQLRTPLSAAKWSLNLLMDEKVCPLGSKEMEYLDIIKNSNERMIKLVNDLLDVSRIEQKRLDLKIQKFSLAKIIQDFITEAAPMAQGHGISLDLEVKANLPDAWADPSRIRLVVQNLIDNAVKYSNEKSAVKIKLGQTNGFLKFEARDNGVGIPERQKDQIFQKFFRSENVKKHQTDGTGLGLFIAKAIVEASGGKIGFVSEEGKGSTFWFTVPIKSWNMEHEAWNILKFQAFPLWGTTRRVASFKF